MPISELENPPLLDVDGLSAGYGRIGVIHEVTLRIAAGEVVSLLGPNGAGKTTLLNAISGMLPRSAGTVTFDGAPLPSGDPRAIAASGLGHVIQGHRVFSGISVFDNLQLAAYDLSRGERAARVEEALSIFPELAEKRNQPGGALSGGQQQMLAVAQGLVKQPKLLMLDEPSAGLSPVLFDRVLSVIDSLRARNIAVVLVEQLIEKALSVSDRVYALSQGRIVLTASADQPDLPSRLEAVYFGAID